MSLDSTPLACIPAGSIVEAKDVVVSPKYDIQTRRVFVRHISPETNKVVEGWASIQSTQGYKILDPVLNLCYKNSRWGASRPLLRQCGHAAHLSCVETHVASIHQKAQAETPYDGRYAADIDDGEFLCPLCKQLCNVVVPAEIASVSTTKEQKGDIHAPDAKSSKALTDQLANLQILLSSKSCMEVSKDGRRKALKQYGNYIEHSMQVFSWDPNQDRKKKAQVKWHEAIKKWDFVENEDHSLYDRNTDNDKPYVSDILRLLRQQHIAWAAAGHTAAAAEASSRGIRKSGFEPSTSDPWEDYDSASRDSHSMVIELSRTLTAASCLQSILTDEINQKLEREELKEDNSRVSVVGHLLGNILRGEFWTSKPENTLGATSDWKIVTALLSSLPCHVSRDETLAFRQEARATASQCWAVNAPLASEAKSISAAQSDLSKVLPPMPLCIRKIGGNGNLRDNWGSMHPSDITKSDPQIFRPGLASGFLYVPLLSWDLTSFAGAIFSSLLSCENAQYQDFYDTARLLVISRIVQCLVTLKDKEKLDNIQIPQYEAEIDISKESSSVVELLNYFKSSLQSDAKPFSHEENFDRALLAYVSYSILPFARTLILLLRACVSTIRHRASDTNGAKQDLLENEDTMYIEDGFYFVLELGCPLPSGILSALTAQTTETSLLNWATLINRWITATQALDTYQGSRGDHLKYNTDSKKWEAEIVERAEKIEKGRIVEGNASQDEDVPSSSNYPFEMDISSQSPNIQDDNLGDTHNNSDDDEIMEVESDAEDTGFMPRALGNFDGMDNALGGDDSSDEEMEHVDEAFDDIGDLFGLPSLPTQSGDIVESNDSEKSQYSWDDFQDDRVLNADDSYLKNLNELYANVSSSAIIPFQSGLLGTKEPGPGPRGAALDYRAAASMMMDASHLGLVHSPGKFIICYIYNFSA